MGNCHIPPIDGSLHCGIPFLLARFRDFEHACMCLKSSWQREDEWIQLGKIQLFFCCVVLLRSCLSLSVCFLCTCHFLFVCVCVIEGTQLSDLCVCVFVFACVCFCLCLCVYVCACCVFVCTKVKVLGALTLKHFEIKVLGCIAFPFVPRMAEQDQEFLTAEEASRVLWPSARQSLWFMVWLGLLLLPTLLCQRTSVAKFQSEPRYGKLFSALHNSRDCCVTALRRHR